MNEPEIAPLAVRLPVHDPALTDLVTAAIAALRLHAAVDSAITADVAAEAAGQGSAWFLFETAAGTVGLAPLVAEGIRAASTDRHGRPDAIVAADALARLEPLVAAIETALALDLHPVDLVPVRPSMATTLDVAMTRAGEASPRHRALLTLPTGFVAPVSRDRARGMVPPGIRSAWTCALEGPETTVGTLRRLARGDLLLLGIGPLRGRWSCMNGPSRLARLDWWGRSLMIDDDRDLSTVEHDPIEYQPEVDVTAGTDGVAAMKLRTTVLIEGGEIDTGAIAGLGAGSVVPLPLSGTGLPVRLLAGGTAIATGDLVTVGDGYGVLVTSVAHDQDR